MKQHPAKHPRLRNTVGCIAAAAAAALACAAAIPGCQKQGQAPKPFIQYEALDPKKGTPEYMKGTVWELTKRMNDEPYAIASYGLVGRLRGTGDTTVSLPVRQWMYKQMARHGVGSSRLQGFSAANADEILRDPNYAIVRVDAELPPGAREGDFIDVQVSAMPGNKTSSLSGGVLFQSELYKVRGNSPDLAGVAMLARAAGPVVVNPAYALTDTTAPGTSGQAKASLRRGVIMDGGVVIGDRAILLRIREPSRPVARAIEQRINDRFQKVADKPAANVMPITNRVAFAYDEGIIEVYVPKAYKGDWEHFIGVVEQLYLNGNPANLVAKARQLADEAMKPDAPLLEISYALEGIGEPAMQYVLPLMVHPNADVAFAMARAAVFIGDPSGAAQDALVRMAKDDAHPFQLAALETIGKLPASPERNQHLASMLTSKNTVARTTAYKVLARNTAPGVQSLVQSRVIQEKFSLDTLEAEGEPLVYASRSGIPRIALIGPRAKLALPITFTTMDKRLMISSDPSGRYVTLFFRDDRRKEPVKMLSRPYVYDVVARLAGEGAPEEDRFDFTYGEIVAILQELSAQKKITASRPDGRLTLAPFVYEQPRDTQDVIEGAPVIEDTRPNTAGRRNGDAAARAADATLPRTEADAAPVAAN